MLLLYHYLKGLCRWLALPTRKMYPSCWAKLAVERKFSTKSTYICQKTCKIPRLSKKFLPSIYHISWVTFAKSIVKSSSIRLVLPSNFLFILSLSIMIFSMCFSIIFNRFSANMLSWLFYSSLFKYQTIGHLTSKYLCHYI